MKKQLEVGQTYKTENGCFVGEVLRTNLKSNFFKCAVLLTDLNSNEEYLEKYTLNGKRTIGYPSELNLIIPEPEPTYRAWNEDEIPVGEKVRGKGKDERTMIILTTDEITKGEIGFVLPNRADEFPYFISCERALRSLEFFNGTSWQPCGVLE